MLAFSSLLTPTWKLKCSPMSSLPAKLLLCEWVVHHWQVARPSQQTEHTPIYINGQFTLCLWIMGGSCNMEGDNANFSNEAMVLTSVSWYSPNKYLLVGFSSPLSHLIDREICALYLWSLIIRAIKKICTCFLFTSICEVSSLEGYNTHSVLYHSVKNKGTLSAFVSRLCPLLDVFSSRWSHLKCNNHPLLGILTFPFMCGTMFIKGRSYWAVLTQDYNKNKPSFILHWIE